MADKNPEVTVECRRPISGFDSDNNTIYSLESHAFCNSIVIPHSYFGRLDAEPYSYLRVSPVSIDDHCGGAVLYGIPFDRKTGPDSALAALSTNLMEKIHPDLGTGDRVRLQSIDFPSDDELVVQRPYSGEQPSGCYVSEETLEKIDCNINDDVEIINTRTGGRAVNEVRLLKPNDDSDQSVRLSLSIIQSIDIKLGEKIKIQEKVDKREKHLSERLKKTTNRVIYKPLVGSRTINLKVCRGLQQDEERDIVRIGSSTRQYLGIDIQDKVKISWKEKQVVAQCLPSTADNDSSNQSLSPAEISIPSTLRDKIGVNPNDTIEVRRDSKYMFKEKIGLSILGILGVVFGTFQVLNSTEWIPVFVSLLGRIQATLLIFGIAGILSFPTLFLLFLPIRSEVD